MKYKSLQQRKNKTQVSIYGKKKSIYHVTQIHGIYNNYNLQYQTNSPRNALDKVSLTTPLFILYIYKASSRDTLNFDIPFKKMNADVAYVIWYM